MTNQRGLLIAKCQKRSQWGGLTQCAVTGQFCGPCVTVRPPNLVSFTLPHASVIDLRDSNKYLTNLVFSVGTVSYRSLFFPVDLWPASFSLGRTGTGKNSVCNLQQGPLTRLVRGVMRIVFQDDVLVVVFSTNKHNQAQPCL